MSKTIKRSSGALVVTLSFAAMSAFAAIGGCGGSSEKNESKGVGAHGGDSGSGGSKGGSPNGGSGGTVPIGGSSGTAGSGNNTGMAGEGGNCGATDIDAEPPAVSILVVVDKSSSMTATPSGFSDDKWTALGAALGEALDAARDSVAFGLDFYPFGDDRDPMASVSTCQMPMTSDILIPIGPGTSSVPLIVDALADYSPAGGTPTAAALARAFEYFTNGDGASIEGDRYVLLATDGGPNCNGDISCDVDTCTSNLDGVDQTPCGGNCCDPASGDPDAALSCLDEDAAVAAVDALADVGIKTFVVGIPGSQAYGSTLDAMAVAGLAENAGAPPSYYRVDAAGGTEGLAEVLTGITRGVIRSCRLQLTSVPEDTRLLNVEIDGRVVPQMGDDGWEVDPSTTPPTIVLKGATCEYMQTMGAENVTITYGCRTETDPH